MCEKCVKNGPPSPRMCEKCVKNGPPSPRMCEKCVKNGPPSPGCVKNASRMVPPSPRMCEKCVKNGPPSPPDVTGPPVFRNFHANPGCAKTAAALVHQCCCNFRTCENCDKTGPPVLLQFSRKMDHCCCSFRTWGGQCCCIFRTCENCNNTGGTSLVAVFAQTAQLVPPGNFRTCEKPAPRKE